MKPFSKGLWRGRGIMIEIIGAINSGFSALKKATDLIKNINDLDKSVAVNSAVTELQQIILDLQRNLFEIQEKYGELQKLKEEWERKALKREEWEKIKEQYVLKEISKNVYAYTLKNPGEEPFHWICPNCFAKEKKVILQNWVNSFECTECNARFSTGETSGCGSVTPGDGWLGYT